MKNIIITILFILFGHQIKSQVLTATIRNAVNDCKSGCIDLHINSNSAPFTVTWYDSNNNELSAASDLSGNDGKEDLCNLYPGKYTVDVYDEYCGFASETFEVKKDDYVYNPSLTTISPTDCGLNNGSIYLINGNPTIGSGSYTLSCKSSTGQQFSIPPNYMTNLSSDNYCIIAKDLNWQCEYKKCVDLLAPQEPVLTSEVLPTCKNSSSGSINIQAISSYSLGHNYSFVFNTGYSCYGCIKINYTNLAAGNYCVTVTDMQNPTCKTIRCFDVGEIEGGKEPLILTEKKVDVCPNSWQGSILLEPKGGLAPYTYKWNDGNYDKDRLNLSSGDYKVTVTDRCGNTIVKSYKIVENEINFTTISGCKGKGQIEANLNFDFNSIKWFGRYPINQLYSGKIFSNVSTGNYIVEVISLDGCKLLKQVSITNSDYNYILTQPCIGVSSGNLNIQVKNPQGKLVKIKFGGLDFILADPYSTNINFNSGDISFLSGSVNLNIEIGDCKYDEIIDVSPDKTSLIASSYDSSNDLCNYDAYCNGSIVVPNFQKSKPYFNIPDYDKCEKKFYCNKGFLVRTEKVDNVWEPIPIYKSICERLGNPGDCGYFSFSDVQPCKRVKYCPLTMKTFATSTFRHLDGNGEIAFNQDGCLLISCYFTLYGNSIYYWCPPPGTVNNDYHCIPKKYSVSQLLNWYIELSNQYPNFINSELDNYLLSLTPDEISKGNCAFIEFCKTDFKIIKKPIFETIECNTIYVSSDGVSKETCKCRYSVNEPNVCKTYCKDPTCNCFIERNLNFNYPNNLNLAPPNPLDGLIRIINNSESEYFKDFAILKELDEYNPNGIYINNSGQYLLENFNNNLSENILKTKIDTLKTSNYFIDFNTKETIYTKELSNKKMLLFYEDTTGLWYKEFSSNNEISIKKSLLSDKKTSLFLD